ncbi:MAG: hypothetical protein O3A96_16970 [Proteobacteria bacterium]|nr:hypothetical protein [Pseudomonadota bacterium]
MLSRRQFLIGSTLASTPIFIGIPALAQSSSDIQKNIAANRAQANELLSEAAEKAPAPLPPDIEADLLFREYRLRQSLYYDLAPLSDEELRKHADPDFSGLIEQYLKYGIEALPPEIRIRLPRPLEPGQSKDCKTEDTLVVLCDIAFETLGISLDRSAIMALLESDPRLSSALDEMAKAVSTKDWKYVAKLADSVFEIATSAEFLARLVKIVGRDGAKKILAETAVKLVPFVGWVYLAILFIISVKNNVNRLTDCGVG